MKLFLPATAPFLLSCFCAFVLLGCKKDSSSSTPAAPTAAFSFTVQNNLPPAVVNFTNTSTGAKSYIWDFGDNTTNSTLQSPTHTYAAKGTYTVTMDAVNDAGKTTVKQQVMVGAKSLTIVNATLNSAMQVANPMSFILTFTKSTGDTLFTTPLYTTPSTGMAVYPAGVWNNLNHLIPLSASIQNRIGVVMSYQIPFSTNPDTFYADTKGTFDINLDSLTNKSPYPDEIILNPNAMYNETKITLDLLWQ